MKEENKYNIVLNMLAERLACGGGNDCPSFKGYITKCFLEKGGEKIPFFHKCRECVVEGIEHYIKGN